MNNKPLGQCSWVQLQRRPLRYDRCYDSAMTDTTIGELCHRHYKQWKILERERILEQEGVDIWSDAEDDTRFDENPYFDYRVASRRNPDDETRKLERLWSSTGDRSIWERWQMAKARAGEPYLRAYITRIESVLDKPPQQWLLFYNSSRTLRDVWHTVDKTQLEFAIFDDIIEELLLYPGEQSELPDAAHGTHFIKTYLSNGCWVETWWNSNLWDEHGLYPGEPIGWYTIPYGTDDQLAVSSKCTTYECMLRCHHRRIEQIIDGSIEFE